MAESTFTKADGSVFNFNEEAEYQGHIRFVQDGVSIATCYGKCDEADLADAGDPTSPEEWVTAKEISYTDSILLKTMIASIYSMAKAIHRIQSAKYRVIGRISPSNSEQQ
jgi:hypothetical protein